MNSALHMGQVYDLDDGKLILRQDLEVPAAFKWVQTPKSPAAAAADS